MRDALPELRLEGRIGVMTGEVATGTDERLAAAPIRHPKRDARGAPRFAMGAPEASAKDDTTPTTQREGRRRAE